MALLNFTLTPESLNKLHDALVCLGKFSEAVCIEAVHDKLILTALNSSKSAYASFTLVGSKFFSKYQFKGTSGSPKQDKFNCKIYNKALLSVFKGKAFDPKGEKDTAVERCDVSVEDGDRKAKSRFIVKIICRHGVLKTYRLTFESVHPMHAMFARESANNCWSISSKTLREFVEHFGPGTEQLDIYSEDGRVSLTSYTEKVMSGNEILKQPLHTTIAIDTLEFGEFSVEERLHIVISVKDFKTIVAHAGVTNTIVKALYSHPSSPMQITYSDEGMMCEFILMTIGESRGSSATPAPNAGRATASRSASRQPLDATAGSRRAPSSNMPPPSVSAAPSISRENPRKKSSAPSQPLPASTQQSDSLFVPQDDDDRQWDPVNYEDDDHEELLWDAEQNAESATLAPTQRLQSTETNLLHATPCAGPSTADARLPPTQRVAPTQRMTDVRNLGMFDD